MDTQKGDKPLEVDWPQDIELVERKKKLEFQRWSHWQEEKMSSCWPA